jgi:hypothetical protein
VGLALAVAIALPACVHASTHVERGEAFTTGQASYDEFFAKVHALHEQAGRARESADLARSALSRALGVDGAADPDVAVEAAQKRAKELKEKRVLMHLQLTPEAKVVATGAAAEASASDLVKAIEDAARGSLELSHKLGGLADQAAELEKQRADLYARSRTELHAMAPVKREEITRELEASKRVIGEDGETIALYAGAASKFVLDLAHAVETGAQASAPPAAAAAAPEKPKPRWTPRPYRGGGAGTPRAPTPPPKKPSGGDDFEP